MTLQSSGTSPTIVMLRIQDPVATPHGIIFSREAILENLLAQKKAIRRKLALWEAQQAGETRKVRSILRWLPDILASKPSQCLLRGCIIVASFVYQVLLSEASPQPAQQTGGQPEGLPVCRSASLLAWPRRMAALRLVVWGRLPSMVQAHPNPKHSQPCARVTDVGG